MVTLSEAKMTLRISTNAFDDEITALINAGYSDLKTAGVISVTEMSEDAVILADRAVKTYVRMSFGQPDDYDRLKKSYDEQKAQLRTFTGATVWDPEEAI